MSQSPTPRQRIASRSERNARAGREGALVQHALYPIAKFRQWGRMGGRPRHQTIAEIRAEQRAAKEARQ